MGKYTVTGHYGYEGSKIEVRGSFNLDRAGLLACSPENLPFRGDLSYNLPGVSGARVSGFSRISNANYMLFVLRPDNEDYIPSLFAVRNNHPEIEGKYKGSWIPVIPELTEKLPDDPSKEDLVNLYHKSREEIGIEGREVELELSEGKVTRAKRHIDEIVGGLRDSLNPKPRPAFSSNKF